MATPRYWSMYSKWECEPFVRRESLHNSCLFFRSSLIFVPSVGRGEKREKERLTYPIKNHPSRGTAETEKIVFNVVSATVPYSFKEAVGGTRKKIKDFFLSSFFSFFFWQISNNGDPFFLSLLPTFRGISFDLPSSSVNQFYVWMVNLNNIDPLTLFFSLSLFLTCSTIFVSRNRISNKRYPKKNFGSSNTKDSMYVLLFTLYKSWVEYQWFVYMNIIEKGIIK